VFQVAERLSQISDALFLEATAADAAQGRTPGGLSTAADADLGDTLADVAPPAATPSEQARAIAKWIHAGRASVNDPTAVFPGLAWLRHPDTYSDREWILEIARQYRRLDRSDVSDLV